MIVASHSRRSFGYSSTREHISATAMTLKMGVETLQLYADHYLAAPEWGAEVVEKRAIGVKLVVGIPFGMEHISASGMTVRIGSRRSGATLANIWLPQRGCAEWVGGVFLGSDPQRSCG